VLDVVEVGDDVGERVVDAVRHTCRQRSDRRHAIADLQAHLDLFAIGDVDASSDHVLGAAADVEQGCVRPRHDTCLAALGSDSALDILGHDRMEARTMFRESSLRDFGLG
jgi:hypothetical protein